MLTYLQFVKAYVSKHKNETFKEAMKSDKVKCAYAQYKKEQICGGDKKEPEEKKKKEKGDTIVNVYCCPPEGEAEPAPAPVAPAPGVVVKRKRGRPPKGSLPPKPPAGPPAPPRPGPRYIPPPGGSDFPFPPPGPPYVPVPVPAPRPIPVAQEIIDIQNELRRLREELRAQPVVPPVEVPVVPENVKQELTDLRNAVAARDSTIGEMKGQKDQLTQQLKQLRETRKNYPDRGPEIDALKKSLEEQRNDLQHKIRVEEAKRKKVEKTLEEKQEDLKRSKKNQDYMYKEYGKLHGEYTDSENKLRTAEEDVKKAVADNRLSQEELKDIKDSLEQLKRSNDDYIEQNKKLQKELEDEKKKFLLPPPIPPPPGGGGQPPGFRFGGKFLLPPPIPPPPGGGDQPPDSPGGGQPPGFRFGGRRKKNVNVIPAEIADIDNRLKALKQQENVVRKSNQIVKQAGETIATQTEEPEDDAFAQNMRNRLIGLLPQPPNVIPEDPFIQDIQNRLGEIPDVPVGRFGVQGPLPPRNQEPEEPRGPPRGQYPPDEDPRIRELQRELAEKQIELENTQQDLRDEIELNQLNRNYAERQLVQQTRVLRDLYQEQERALNDADVARQQELQTRIEDFENQVRGAQATINAYGQRIADNMARLTELYNLARENMALGGVTGNFVAPGMYQDPETGAWRFQDLQVGDIQVNKDNVEELRDPSRFTRQKMPDGVNIEPSRPQTAEISTQTRRPRLRNPLEDYLPDHLRENPRQRQIPRRDFRGDPVDANRAEFEKNKRPRYNIVEPDNPFYLPRAPGYGEAGDLPPADTVYHPNIVEDDNVVFVGNEFEQLDEYGVPIEQNNFAGVNPMNIDGFGLGRTLGQNEVFYLPLVRNIPQRPAFKRQTNQIYGGNLTSPAQVTYWGPQATWFPRAQRVDRDFMTRQLQSYWDSYKNSECNFKPALLDADYVTPITTMFVVASVNNVPHAYAEVETMTAAPHVYVNYLCGSNTYGRVADEIMSRVQEYARARQSNVELTSQDEKSDQYYNTIGMMQDPRDPTLPEYVYQMSSYRFPPDSQQMETRPRTWRTVDLTGPEPPQYGPAPMIDLTGEGVKKRGKAKKKS